VVYSKGIHEQYSELVPVIFNDHPGEIQGVEPYRLSLKKPSEKLPGGYTNKDTVYALVQYEPLKFGMKGEVEGFVTVCGAKEHCLGTKKGSKCSACESESIKISLPQTIL